MKITQEIIEEIVRVHVGSLTMSKLEMRRIRFNEHGLSFDIKASEFACIKDFLDIAEYLIDEYHVKLKLEVRCTCWINDDEPGVNGTESTDDFERVVIEIPAERD